MFRSRQWIHVSVWTTVCGPLCETSVDFCQPSPCFNGVCINVYDLHTFACQCNTGYTGELCETGIDYCSPNPCGVNSIDCHSVLSQATYQCQCVTGYTGYTCELNIDDCQSSPCRNGGSCQDLVNSYSCHCPPGFTGHHCEVNIDECQSQPCRNGGTCEDKISAFQCHCPPYYGGVTCEERLRACPLNAFGPDHHCDGICHCRDGAQCDDITGFCANGCDKGFKGEYCQEFSCNGLLPGRYRDPYDCNHYFVCIENPIVSCGDYKWWNDAAKVCDHPSNVHCAATDHVDYSAYFCDIAGRAPGGYYADPTDCSQYFICTQDYRKQCPAGLSWNSHLNTCDYPFNVPGCEYEGGSSFFGGLGDSYKPKYAR